MVKRWTGIVMYGLIAIAVLVYRDPILRWLESDASDHIGWMIGAAALLATVPVVPFGVVAGIMGAKFGPVAGGLINVASSTFGALVLFCAVRFAFREQGRRYIARFRQLDRFMRFMERNAFMAVLAARLIPFVPAPLVNAASAISAMKAGSFALATALGKIPVMFVFAFIGHRLLESVSAVLWITLLYLLFLAAVYAGYLWYRRKYLSS
ncbi:TVP38/TMEM64 family protein [Paenibacillus piri]|nr:VTT domain-containing protein [Paenibacillus piri]